MHPCSLTRLSLIFPVRWKFLFDTIEVCIRSEFPFLYEWPPLLNIHVLWPYSVRICHSFVFISVILFHVCRGFSPTICPPFASSICFARLMRSSFSAPGGPISPSLQSTVSILMCKCWSPSGVIHVEEPVLELVLVVVTVSPPANDHLVTQFR